MIPLLSGRFARIAALAFGASITFLTSACAPPPATVDIPDPMEPLNQVMYKFNRGFDKAILRPIADTMGDAGNSGFFKGISNFAGNLDLPVMVLNDILQLKGRDAVINTLRFGVNTTFGLGGFLDPAADMGMFAKETDFGATLYTYGMGAGDYVVLPFTGPSNTRDTVGILVDDVIDPMRLVVSGPILWVGAWAQMADKLGSRMRHSETVDSVLYDSADGYAQTKLLFNQYRQYELGQAPSDDSFVDPYEDPYAK